MFTFLPDGKDHTKQQAIADLLLQHFGGAKIYIDAEAAYTALLVRTIILDQMTAIPDRRPPPFDKMTREYLSNSKDAVVTGCIVFLDDSENIVNEVVKGSATAFHIQQLVEAHLAYSVCLMDNVQAGMYERNPDGIGAHLESCGGHPIDDALAAIRALLPPNSDEILLEAGRKAGHHQ